LSRSPNLPWRGDAAGTSPHSSMPCVRGPRQRARPHREVEPRRRRDSKRSAAARASTREPASTVRAPASRAARADRRGRLGAGGLAHDREHDRAQHSTGPRRADRSARHRNVSARASRKHQLRPLGRGQRLVASHEHRRIGRDHVDLRAELWPRRIPRVGDTEHRAELRAQTTRTRSAARCRRTRWPASGSPSARVIRASTWIAARAARSSRRAHGRGRGGEASSSAARERRGRNLRAARPLLFVLRAHRVSSAVLSATIVDGRGERRVGVARGLGRATSAASGGELRDPRKLRAETRSLRQRVRGGLPAAGRRGTRRSALPGAALVRSTVGRGATPTRRSSRVGRWSRSAPPMTRCARSTNSSGRAARRFPTTPLTREHWTMLRHRDDGNRARRDDRAARARIQARPMTLRRRPSSMPASASPTPSCRARSGGCARSSARYSVSADAPVYARAKSSARRSTWRVRSGRCSWLATRPLTAPERPEAGVPARARADVSVAGPSGRPVAARSSVARGRARDRARAAGTRSASTIRSRRARWQALGTVEAGSRVLGRAAGAALAVAGRGGLNLSVWRARCRGPRTASGMLLCGDVPAAFAGAKGGRRSRQGSRRVRVLGRHVTYDASLGLSESYSPRCPCYGPAVAQSDHWHRSPTCGGHPRARASGCSRFVVAAAVRDHVWARPICASACPASSRLRRGGCLARAPRNVRTPSHSPGRPRRAGLVLGWFLMFALVLGATALVIGIPITYCEAVMTNRS